MTAVLVLMTVGAAAYAAGVAVALVVGAAIGAVILLMIHRMIRGAERDAQQKAGPLLDRLPPPGDRRVFEHIRVRPDPSRVYDWERHG